MAITTDLMECPKCGHVDEPVLSYRFRCDLPGYSHVGEHFHVTCRRCDYPDAIPVPVKP